MNYSKLPKRILAKIKSPEQCPICNNIELKKIRKIGKFTYYQCLKCESLFLEKKYMTQVDEGRRVVKYGETYWNSELIAAKERAYGPCLARAAEAFYYCQREINTFLDIGTGPGYFLDAITKYLPSQTNMFYGIEKFPPKETERTNHANFLVGDLEDLELKFDAGLCVEVVEHLTPKMLRNLLKGLASVSNDKALYIFNTGLPEYVLNEDINYLDPIKRGHVGCYSVKGINVIAQKYGFKAFPIKGKTWAYCLEFNSAYSTDHDITTRVWSALEINKGKLIDMDMGSTLQILGRETVLAYL